jgi:hypothetical protein
MNCKQGDMAVVVHRRYSWDGWRIGHIAKCVEPDFHPITKEPAWVIDPPLISPTGEVHDAIIDAILRPIRDPGDDATDEVVQRIGKPEGVTA